MQKYGYFVDEVEESTTNNRGVAIWTAFVIGSGLQTVGYFLIIGTTDWNYVSKQSRSRFMCSASENSGSTQISEDIEIVDAEDFF